MDGAPAIRPLRAGGRACVSHGGARESRSERIDNCRAHLANEFRPDRKRATDRDRSALCLALRDRLHLLANLVGAETIALAYLDCSVDFSRTRLAGERPDAPFLFLRNHAGTSLAQPRTANNLERPAFDRPYNNDVDLRRLGDSVRGDNRRSAHRSRLVAAVLRAPWAGRLPFRKLGTEHSAQPELLFAVARFCAVVSRSEIFLHA